MSNVARLVLRRVERLGESTAEFLHRVKARSQYLFESFEIVSFQAQLLKMHRSWIGHIPRTGRALFCIAYSSGGVGPGGMGSLTQTP